MLRVGMISAAHVHAPSYARCLAAHPGAEWIGGWDDDPSRMGRVVDRWGGEVFPSLESLLGVADAVVVCSPNLSHARHIEAAADVGKPVLCEKPLAASRQELDRISLKAEQGAWIMTAFPCPFSPVFQRARQRLEAGDIGRPLAVSATNRGKCPGGWFVDPAQSGGGAMIDHTVHVADLLWRLLGEAPVSVSAQVGRNMHGQLWEDTAHLTLDFPSGVFATLDSSWSRPGGHRTWGDVTFTVTGTCGVLEVDLFGQGVVALGEACRLAATGSDLDALMVDEFVSAVTEGREPLVSAQDGLRASEVALQAYESLAA